MIALLTWLWVGVFFVLPMFLYIWFTERRSRVEYVKAIDAGRTEPVTIQPYVDLSLCMGAGACVTACPEGVLRLIDGQAVAVNMSACIGHGVCVPVCPVDAIELVFGSEKRGIDIPEVGPGFETNVKGLYIAGELGGMGLIAAAAEQGVQAMQAAATGLQKAPGRKDVIIVGAGPAGLAAALVAKQKGLDYLLVDQGEVGGVVRHYPRKKLVFTRPMTLPLYGKVNLKQLYKEELVKLFEDIVAKCAIQVSSNERVEGVSKLPDGGFSVKTVNRTVEGQRVILALGRGGTPRKLDVPGEEQEKVSYSLLEPEHFQNEHLVVVGGGDSAVEAAMQLGEQPGNKVLLSYRGDKINRPKEKNIKRLKDAVKKGQVELLLSSQIKEIGVDRVVLDQKGESIVLPNDHVFVFVGGVLPTKFLEQAGIRIRKHYGKRVVDADEDRKAKKDAGKGDAGKNDAGKNDAGKKEKDETKRDEAKRDPKQAGAGPRAGLSPNSLPTALVPVPGDAATAVLPDPFALDPGEATAPRAELGEETVPRAAPPAPPAGETTVPRASPLELAPLRDEDTNPPGAPRLGDVPTAVLSPAEQAAALDEGPYDETPIGGPEVEQPRRRREVTEIQPLRRVATIGADRAAPEPPPPEPLGRVVAARPAPPEAPAAPSPTPAPAPERATPPAERATPAPAADREVGGAPRAAEGPTGLSRGISRVGRTAAPTRAPDAGGPAPEVRPDSRRADLPSGKVRLPEPVAAASAPPGARGATDPFVAAAQAQLAEGRFGEVLLLASDLRGVVERSGAALPELERARSRRLVLELEGRAHLGLGDWESALDPLREAVELGRREGSSVELGAVLLDLGRAYHHAGRYGDARAVLSSALDQPGVEGERRAGTLRLLGDLDLRGGQLDLAEQQFEEARRATGDAAGQARALRGRAHVLAVRGDFPEALSILERAGQLLGPDGAPEIVAGIQARAIELETAMGQYGRAFQRAEDLAASTARRRLADHQAEAVSLLAEVLALLGMQDLAAEAAGQVDSLARHLGPRGAEARIRAARAACEVGRPELATRLLDAVGPQTQEPVDDLEGQHLAVRARALARRDPATARELATGVLARPTPLLVLRAARIRLDAALALLEVGAPSTARAAVKRGLKDVQGAGTRGLKLELLVAMYLAEPDHRVVEAVARSALKVLDELPDHCARAFRRRAVIANALERWSQNGGA
jgi:thioredoxin reductase (NADPH)